MWIGIAKYSVIGVKDTLEFPTGSCASNHTLSPSPFLYNYSATHVNQSVILTSLAGATTLANPQIPTERSVDEAWLKDLRLSLSVRQLVRLSVFLLSANVLSVCFPFCISIGYFNHLSHTFVFFSNMCFFRAEVRHQSQSKFPRIFLKIVWKFSKSKMLYVCFIDFIFPIMILCILFLRLKELRYVCCYTLFKYLNKQTSSLG